MIRNTSIIAVTALLSGCHVLPWSAQRQAAVGEPLPMTVSCEDLVDHLNRQAGNLKAWQSTDLRLTARLPGAPPMLPMKGSIACESPNRFHLRASNVVATADMGANSEQCWFQSTPGHSGVISWRHEDAHLLQEFPEPIPYIDPDWLMLVLGVKQLDPGDYVLGPGEDPRAKELWLTSIRDTPGQGAYRYVIKVSTRQRVIREHVAYDQDHRVIVRARLSDHASFDGHLIPRTVRIDLPANKTQLKLTFSKINTDPEIASSMWVVPSVPNGQNVDLGELIRASRFSDPNIKWDDPPPRRATLGTPQFVPLEGARQTVQAVSNRLTDESPEEPEWAASAGQQSPFASPGYEQPRRRRFWGLFPMLR